MNVDYQLERLVQNLKLEVDAELANPEIPSDNHGRPIGYHKGCRGPLCKKQHRDRLRRPDQSPLNPWMDEYLEGRLEVHKESLKDKKEKVA